MKLLNILILSVIANFSVCANAQQINNATVNLQGANQNVAITQSGASHSATVSITGNGASFIGSQSGTTSQTYSFSVDCGTSCPNSPYTITQY